MQIKDCSSDDIPLLSKLNQSLIEDEKAETNLTLQQLEERMESFIREQYKAFLFYEMENVVGYPLKEIHI